MRTASRRFGRRALTGVMAVATITTMAAWSVGTPASAGGLIKPTLGIYAPISEDGQTILATVNVRAGSIKNGLGVTPTGSVHFSDNVGDDLGTAALPSCLLKPCVASLSIPVSSLSDGVTQLLATYSGDTLLKPGTIGEPLSFVHCDPDDGCFGEATEPGADLEVTSTSSTGYVVANFDADGLPCGVDGGGPVAHIVGHGLNADKSVYYTLNGAGAQAYETMLTNGQFSDGDHTAWVCYVSKDPFAAYSPDGYHTDFPESDASFNNLGPAPQIVGGVYDGYYVGLLAWCGASYNIGDSNFTVDAPCVSEFDLYQNSDSGNSWNLLVNLCTPPGDPLLAGKKLLAPAKL